MPYDTDQIIQKTGFVQKHMCSSLLAMVNTLVIFQLLAKKGNL